MNFKITIIIFFISFFSFSQSITGRVLDKTTQNPIPYATIKTGSNSGVISNDEGYFTINTTKDKSISISCMGYEHKIITVKDLILLNYNIELTEAINQLSEVYISNKNPNVDSIILKVKRNLTGNYNYNLNKYSIFKRTTDYLDFKKLEFEIEKATHVKKKNLKYVNDELIALSEKIKKSNIINFSDFKGELYTFNKDSSKLKVQKATELLDSNNDFSVEQIQEKSQKIVLKYLDTTKTYKLKTGIFKIEDSLSIKDENKDRKKEFVVSYLNKSTNASLKLVQPDDESFLNKFLNLNLYTYSYKDVVFNNNEITHIINFTPKKSKAKYTGQLFINDANFAITRIDYKYYKGRHGEKLNLKFVLGIKYNQNLSSGTFIFEKDSSNLYHPKYLKHSIGQNFYVDRGIKL